LNAALSAENCRRLEAIANQYARVELTSAQKQLKQIGGLVRDELLRDARC
jgi:hypothetical protein